MSLAFVEMYGSNNDEPETYNHQNWLTQMSQIYVDFHPITEQQKTNMILIDQYYNYLKLLTKRPDKFVWLTVRPKKCTEKDFQHFITKFLSAKCIKEYYLAYEWKQNEEQTGLHAHIILLGDVSRINEKIAYFRKVTLLPKVGKMQFYNTTFNNAYIQDKINYCNEQTHCPEKNIQKLVNPILRKKHNMPNINTIKLPLNYHSI